MLDRISLYPGRVTLTPVSGQANTYDMERADSPTQEGTPLNKASLLKDTTAALYGLTASAVPDEVLGWIGKYNEHWWESYAENSGYIVNIGGEMEGDDNGWYCVAANTNRDIQYASSVSVDSSGNIFLNSPSTMTIVCNGSNQSGWSTLMGKYLTNLLFDPTGVYYYGTDENDSYMKGFYASSGQYIDQNIVEIHGIHEVTSQYYSETCEFIGYVYSTDRNAYPDSGTVSGITYSYLGVPFEKFPTMPRIEMGTYVGTGTYGASNPNTIAFSQKPKIIFSIPYDYHALLVIMPDTITGTLLYPVGDCMLIRQRVSYVNGSLSWHVSNANTNQQAAEYQHNYLGTTYHYIAVF